MKSIVIVGPPLSGKGTQSKKMIAAFGYVHLSTGDVLRAEKAAQTDLGLEAEKYSKKGLLVPDDLVEKLLRKFIEKHKNAPAILFDGYPRNQVQAETLVRILKEQDSQIDQLVLLTVPETELHRRAKERAEKEGRADDAKKSTVENRLAIFKEQTLPMAYSLEEQGYTLTEIDGMQSVEAVFKSIKEALS